MVHISAQLSLIFEFFDKILFLKTIENHFLKIIFKNLLLRMVFWNIAKESLKFLSLVLYQMVRQLEIVTHNYRYLVSHELFDSWGLWLSRNIPITDIWCIF